MQQLTIQAFIQQQWQDIAILFFPEIDQGNYSKMKVNYVAKHIERYFLEDNACALSLNYPVDLFFDEQEKQGLRFLDDLMPSGASRRYWLKYLNISHLPYDEQNYLLLKQVTIAPIGNLRVKEATMAIQPATQLFDMEEVINRDVNFLEYAQQNGAMAGGATGAGGEAPKLLLRCNSQQKVWIDNLQNGQSDDQYYLVKYPRGQRLAIDCDILRAEYHYYAELQAMGFNTINTANMRLMEGVNYPSLWLPRFDVWYSSDGKTQRYAMESVYSILKREAGSLLDHNQTIRCLIAKIENSNMVANGFKFDRTLFVIEWVKRDLLNIAFGNSDNHGRNTAFLRDRDSIQLAPIYDFAPMKADPEGIIRLTTWSTQGKHPLEQGGQYNYAAIIESLSDLVEPEVLWQELRKLAAQLVDLKMRLTKRGVPKSILTFPSIGFDYLPEKLTRWGLL
ncbi:type II toxin-antitoxin system HipA family toxin [Conservatibacter flavescens]|uniref:Toxin HipA n=1 Tax=Conservatibacter flavescens TaxID=28161 RepID=A0A2M8S3D4_9PAST|nr:HipA domain-containing protein [Conservatibacter flavescens]PJG85663.1 toxin HipA [Conservatibacter flavescens]